MSSRPLPRAPRLRLAGVLALASILSCEINKLLQDGGASDPPPARLEFAPPASATAGEPLSPAVRVSAVDSSGSVDTTFQGPVTVTLGENPGRDTLRGTSTVNAERGVATFSNLSINRAATGYTLVATAPGVRGATSAAFAVAPAAAARLAFTAQPHGARVDSVLTPPVQVTAFDTLGNVATGFAGDVTLALAANSNGGALRGTTIVAAASGVATFANLSINRAGTGYRLTASAGQLAAATSDAFEITAAAPTTGDLTVDATTTGDNQPGSYTVTVDGSSSSSRTIASNGAGTTYSGLPAGDHTVALTDVPANCTVSGGASKPVTVPAGGAATAAFTINCTALTGSLTVSTTTTGANLDPDGYTFAVDGGTPQPIGISATIPLTEIPSGSRTVVLAGVAGNCTVANGPSRTVIVPPGGTATAAFAVSCAALTGDLAVTTSTSGANPPSAYSVTVDGGSSKSIGASDSVTYSGIAAANHSVRLNDVPANCSVNGLNPRIVTVPAGGAVEASFTITCSALTGTLNVTTSTSGDSPDPNGYSFTVDNGTPQSIADSQTIALTLPTGSHTVRLGDVASNCTVTNGTSRTVMVTAGGAVSASFTITCQALTGSLTVTTSTSGPNAPSSYAVTVDGAQSKSIAASGTVSYSGLTPSSHSVQLNGVPSNCSVSEANPQTITVTSGGTAQASFTITCQALTGSLTVSTSTSGPDQPAGYTVTLDGSTSRSIGPTDNVTFSNLSPASHTVVLSSVPSNCSVNNGTSRTVTVSAGGTASTSFTITCASLTGDLTVNTSTSGSDQPASYTASVNGGGSQTIDANGSVTFSGLTAGSHTVTLSGVPGNCSVSGGTSHSATVPAGGTGSTSFTITCQALTGSLTVTTSTSGPNAPSSYTVTVDGTQSKSIGASGNVSYSGLTPSSHSVQLNGVPSNCSVSEANPQTVNVPAGGSATASFTITCAAPNQPPVVIAGDAQRVLLGLLFTLQGASFSDPDHDGPWTVTIDWGDGTSNTFGASEGSIGGSHSYPVTLLGGDYTLTITVVDAHGARSSASKTVHVVVA